eukprot:9249875-Pyramimonas_sp.AAC.1
MRSWGSPGPPPPPSSPCTPPAYALKPYTFDDSDRKSHTSCDSATRLSASTACRYLRSVTNKFQFSFLGV